MTDLPKGRMIIWHLDMQTGTLLLQVEYINTLYVVTMCSEGILQLKAER